MKSTSKIQVLIESGTAWGMRLSDLDEATLWFRSAIPISKLEKVNPKEHKLHCVLGGDIAFINMVVGLQGCSATWPCHLCEMLLATLKKREGSMTAGQRSSAAQEIYQGPKKGSQDERLVHPPATHSIRLLRILLAPLHVILGVVK